MVPGLVGIRNTYCIYVYETLDPRISVSLSSTPNLYPSKIYSDPTVHAWLTIRVVNTELLNETTDLLLSNEEDRAPPEFMSDNETIVLPEPPTGTMVTVVRYKNKDIVSSSC